MVNNAGVASEARSPKPIWETTEEIFDKTHRINARGVFLGCKYGGRQMLNQATENRGQRAGTIINVGSVLGVLGKTGTPAYAAAKGSRDFNDKSGGNGLCTAQHLLQLDSSWV